MKESNKIRELFLAHKTLLAIHALALTIIMGIIPFSYFLNFGWMRAFFAPVFIAYFFVFIAFNSSYMLCLWIAPWRMVPLFWLSGLTYVAANLLFPDMADSGNPYACFGQIEIVGPEPDLKAISLNLVTANLGISLLQLIQLAIDLTLKFRKSRNHTSDPSPADLAPEPQQNSQIHTTT